MFFSIKKVKQRLELRILTCLVVSLIFNYNFISFVNDTYKNFRLIHFFQTKNVFYKFFNFIISSIKNFLSKQLIIKNTKLFIITKNKRIKEYFYQRIFKLFFFVKFLYRFIPLKKRKSINKFIKNKINNNKKKFFNTQYFVEIIIVLLFSKRKWITGDKAIICIPHFVLYNYNLIFVLNNFFSFLFQIIEMFFLRKKNLKVTLYFIFDFLGIIYVLLFIYFLFYIFCGIYLTNVFLFSEAANLLTGDSPLKNVFGTSIAEKYKLKDAILIDKKYK